MITKVSQTLKKQIMPSLPRVLFQNPFKPIDLVLLNYLHYAVGDTVRSVQDKNAVTFEVKADKRTPEYFDQAIEKLESKYNSLNGSKNEGKKVDVATISQIYQQTLANHYAEVKILKAQIESLDKSVIRNALNRGLETLQETKGHLKLFQDFVLELIKIQGNSILLDNERLVKMQLAISHIQQVATRFSFERINKDIELIKNVLKGIVPDYAPVALLTGSVKDTPLEAKYFQQLEKIRTENEILQNKMGVLEATIHEVEGGKSLNSPNKVENNKTSSYRTGDDANLYARIISGLLSKSKEGVTNNSLMLKIQELNKKLISLMDEVAKQQKENGVLRKRLLNSLP